MVQEDVWFERWWESADLEERDRALAKKAWDAAVHECVCRVKSLAGHHEWPKTVYEVAEFLESVMQPTSR